MPTRLSSEDIQNIRLSLQPDFQEIRDRLDIAEEKIDHLMITVDGVNLHVQKHEQEWTVLRAQHRVMSEALIRKRVVTENDLSIQ